MPVLRQGQRVQKFEFRTRKWQRTGNLLTTSVELL